MVLKYIKGRTVAKVVSRRPLTAHSWVRTWIIPRGICGGKSGTGNGKSFFSEFFGFPVGIISPWLSVSSGYKQSTRW